MEAADCHGLEGGFGQPEHRSLQRIIGQAQAHQDAVGAQATDGGADADGSYVPEAVVRRRWVNVVADANPDAFLSDADGLIGAGHSAKGEAGNQPDNGQYFKQEHK